MNITPNAFRPRDTNCGIEWIGWTVESRGVQSLRCIWESQRSMRRSHVPIMNNCIEPHPRLNAIVMEVKRVLAAQGGKSHLAKVRYGISLGARGL